MNERIQRYLDGELTRGDLTPDDLRELEAYEDIIRETERTHRSVEVPDLTARVMARLGTQTPAPDEAPARPRGVAGALNTVLGDTLGWLWAPRALQFRPAWGLLAAAAFLLIVFLPRGATRPGPELTEVSETAANTGSVTGQVFVQFRLDAPGASAVRLAGSFTDWEPAYTLNQAAPGVWSILVPLEPGVHDYNFVVNGGDWVPDPVAPAVDDGFGGVNSRLSVLLPEDARLL